MKKIKNGSQMAGSGFVLLKSTSFYAILYKDILIESQKAFRVNL